MPQQKEGVVKIQSEIGERIKEARENCGLKQDEVAKKLHVTLTAYQNYEYGKRDIKSSMILSICAVLKCSPNWLLGYSDEGAHLAEDSLMLRQLREAFDALNDIGQQKVVGYAKDLTHIPAYTERKNTSATDNVQEVAG